MKIFDKGTIESFAIGVDFDIIDDAFSTLTAIIDNALSDLKKDNAFIIGTSEIMPINEFYTGAISPNSTFDVFLILTSSQLEFNSIKLNKNKLKNFSNRIKIAWQDQKINKKKKRRWWRKSENKLLDNQLPKTRDKNKYNIFDFNRDLLNMIARYITQTTICSLERGVITINGESLPFKTRIIPVVNKFGSYNFFLENKGKFINIDFKNRFKNLDRMIEKFGNNFLVLLRIFNTLYFNLYNASPNQIFIESLVFNLPSEVFLKKSNYESFVFAINFLINTNLSTLNSISDSKKIYEDKLCETNINQIKDFFNKIKKYSN